MKTSLKKSIHDHYKKQFVDKKFVPGKTHIPASGKAFDEKEMFAMTEAVLDGWWTEGRFSERFEKKFARFNGVKRCILTNSGSSANLLAISALTSTSLGSRRLKAGDEVITLAAGFPTTVNPIIQHNLVPVFVDISVKTQNVDIDKLKKLITKKTKAIFIPHHLGNPFNIKEVKRLCRAHKLWLVEDCCDALGSKYNGKNVGNFGDLATYSFYAAHHITTGEGGAVLSNNNQLATLVRSFRDWGREYWFKTGQDIKQDKGLSKKLNSRLPADYDNKFIFSEVGYNLKFNDVQAALGLVQLSKIKDFAKIRQENFNRLQKELLPYEKFVSLPKAEKLARPSWFGFMVTIKKNAPFKRKEMLDFLHKNNVGTRMLMAGNVTKQPYFRNNKVKFRKGNLTGTDYILKNSFWIGVHQGIDKKRMSHMVSTLKSFFVRYI